MVVAAIMPDKKEDMIMIKKHLEMLGKPAKDLVTGQEGVVTSMSFDLYGCIQAVLTPQAKDGRVLDGNWMDVTRIEILSDEVDMEIPDFSKGYTAEGRKGPAEKPLS